MTELETAVTFETYFRASSYLMIACGALALAVSDGVGFSLGALFAGVLLVAWKLEGSRWQLSERVGLFIVLLSLPLFYFDWRFLAGAGVVAQERVGVSALAHLILFLSSVKLLQVKADRDWVFLYLISFFEVLLSAGLSISPTFLATLSLYLLFALSTIIAFEIRKARRGVAMTETRLLVAPDSTLIRRLKRSGKRRRQTEVRRLPLVAGAMLLLIFVFALPLFFITPRSGASALTRGDTSLGGFVGFSDRVELGSIGRLQQSNQVVMRVRVEDSQAERTRYLRWRGVALDQFDGQRWQKSRNANLDIQANNDKGFFQLGTTEGLHRLTTQTFFVEPIDTPVLFAAPRVVALQAALPYVRIDKEGALSTHPHTQDRLSYKVYSDTEEPDPELLRADTEAYPRGFRYLLLPATLDERIARLAREIIVRSGARNRYDASRAIESYLQTEFGYTLDLKAGGQDPLADFLFNVREGHCEYFSTAMAVMLRTQGIASRVVNGFQRGEYNDTADVYTVTQRDAHSWVEVYFPETNSWVTFDPTPAAGRPVRESTGLMARAHKYAEALELFWMQYVIGYDKQEQRSLATSVRGQLAGLRRTLAEKFESLKNAVGEFFSGAPGQGGSQSAYARIVALLILLPLFVAIIWLARRVWRLGFKRGFKLWRREREGHSAIEFYERLTKVLAARGLRREPDQTPLEFAAATGMSEALQITRAYNRVRYGEQHLSPADADEIEEWLKRMEGKQRIVNSKKL